MTWMDGESDLPEFKTLAHEDRDAHFLALRQNAKDVFNDPDMLIMVESFIDPAFATRVIVQIDKDGHSLIDCTLLVLDIEVAKQFIRTMSAVIDAVDGTT